MGPRGGARTGCPRPRPPEPSWGACPSPTHLKRKAAWASPPPAWSSRTGSGIVFLPIVQSRAPHPKLKEFWGEPAAEWGGEGERKRGRTIGPKRLGQTSGWSGGRAPRAGAPGTRWRLPTEFCAWEVLPAALRPRDSLLRSGAWDSGLGCPLPRCSSMAGVPPGSYPPASLTLVLRLVASRLP